MQCSVILVLIFGILCSYAVHAQSGCEAKNGAGKLEIKRNVYRFQEFQKCWIIKVPSGSQATLNLAKFSASRTDRADIYVEIGDKKIPANGNFEDTVKEDTTINFYARNIQNAHFIVVEFMLNYEVINGADDEKTTTAVSTETSESGVEINIDGVEAAKAENMEWLMKMRDDWGNDLPSVVTALHLAGKNFNDEEGKQIIKDLQLMIAFKLLSGKPQEPSDLAMVVNSLLAACLDPAKHFPENDLVEKLIGLDLKDTGTSVKTLVYMARCNAGKQLTDEQQKEMDQLLKQPPIYLEMQTIGAMVLACAARFESPKINPDHNITLHESIEKFKNYIERGNFNDVFITAQVMQAIIAVDKSYMSSNDAERAVKYLIREMKRSKDMHSVLQVLPVLNGKSEVDIGCSKSSQMQANNDIWNLESTSKKISVRLEEDIIHSKTMVVLDGLTPLQFLEMAAKNDRRFRHKTRTIEGHVIIYEVFGIPNNIRTGKYWQVFYTEEPTTTVVDSSALEQQEDPDAEETTTAAPTTKEPEKKEKTIESINKGTMKGKAELILRYTDVKLPKEN